MSKFKVGDRVSVNANTRYKGEVKAVFETDAGKVMYVIDSRGLHYIRPENNLEPLLEYYYELDSVNGRFIVCGPEKGFIVQSTWFHSHKYMTKAQAEKISQYSCSLLNGEIE